MHTDLELWDCYLEIIGSLESISIISCHERLGDYIQKRFGIKSVTSYVIPGESRYQRVFNQQPKEEHFPVVYEDLIGKLPYVSKDKVFLVGAGFLGKIYCDLIKQYGGIALDLGSQMDRWAGYQTRIDNEFGMTFQGLRYTSRSRTKPELPA